MVENSKNIDEYLRLSKEFAIKQLKERWLFEVELNKKLFSTIPSIEELITDTHSVLNLSYEEYLEIYNNIITSLK